MVGNSPVVAVGHSKPPKQLTATEKWLAGLLIVLGLLLIVGTMTWFALSTENGTFVSKEVTTTEPVGSAASGTKEVDETDYAETVVIFALTIGAVMVISGAFFGRIREIKVGGGSVVLQAPEDEAKKAEEKAVEAAKAAAPSDKEDKAAELARTLAAQQIDLAYAMAPPSAKAGVADAVATSAATTAVNAVAPTAAGTD